MNIFVAQTEIKLFSEEVAPRNGFQKFDCEGGASKNGFQEFDRRKSSLIGCNCSRSSQLFIDVD